MKTELNLGLNLPEEDEKGDSEENSEEVDETSEEEVEDDDSDTSEEDDSSEEEESHGMSLEDYNKKVGKNYKSWDQVTKSELERDKTISQKEESNTEADKKPSKPAVAPAPSNADSELLEEMYLEKHPEYNHVKDKAKEIAKAENITPIQAFRKYKHLQSEGLTLAEEQEEEDKSKKKTSSPSHQGNVKKDFDKVTNKDISQMTPEQRVKLAEEQEKKEEKKRGIVD